MTLAELSIRRPVLTLVISLLITLAGGLSLAKMGVREYPAVDPPTITIVTSYPGASSEVVQAQITEPIEEAVNAVSGIRNLTSTSREGVSQITVEFTLDTDLDTAASDVRDQLSRAARNLPPDSNPPILNKANADSSPLLGIAIRSELRSQLELSGFADTLRERLQTVPGIAQVDQPAEKRYAMRLWMDAEKLAGHGLTPSEVRRALARENVELPSGRVEGESMELPIKTLGRLNTPADFDAMILRGDGDSIVRFGDVGYAELGPQNERGALKSDGRPIAGLYFRPQPGANQIEIVDALRARIDRIRKELPADIQLEVAYDNTSYVRRSLLEVTETIFIAFGLVVLVVFAFFREWRTTLIPVLAIPVSIIGTFAIMAACGFSINTLTLLGIVLAIGLVVDDAIVVLENIYKRIEHGERPMAAAIAGTEQIFTAVISTTMTLAVVFLPLLFMGGLSGRLFREFAVTISGAVLISAVVALTLTPMLSARMLSTSVGGGWLFRRTEGFFEAMESGYRIALGRFLAWRWLSVVILGLAAWSGYTVYQRLPRELSPLEDRGRLWLRATAPEGVSYEHMQSLADELALVAAERVPEATLMMTQVPGSGGAQGVQGAINSAFVRVFLSDKSERKRSQQEIAAALQPVQRELTGARVNITQEASIGERRAGQSGIQFVIQAPELADLRRVLPKFLEEVRKNSAFTFVDSDLKFDKPEVTVSIDRDKSRALGLSARDIAEAVQASLSGQRMGFFLHQGKQYEVIGQMIRQFRSKPGDLSDISLRTPEGDMVQLANLVNLRESSSPPELYRFNRYSSATISATLARGVAMGDGIAALQAAAKSTLDEKFTTSLTGAAQDFVESSSSLGYVFILAIVLIYLVLGAQFESFIHPLVILLTVPLALCGALLALWWFDQTLNIFSQIGLIMLIGLVTKNGILIVEFANQRLEAGAPTPLDAIREAAPARLRPILMTTLATILGIVPIALALGAGAESRMSMGIAVIGGLVVGGALTLFVIPAMFLLFSRKRLPQAGEAVETIEAEIAQAAAARA